MKTTIYLIIGLCVIIWSGNPKITLSPFSFHLESWRNMIGLVFLVLSLTFFQMHYEKKGMEKTMKMVNEAFEETTKELKSKKASAEKRENEETPEPSINNGI